MDTSPTVTSRVRKPDFALPAGACDSHFHIVGPASRFPFAPGLNHAPADADRDTLYAFHRQIGISRGVIVQTAAHGFDNAVTEDGIRAGQGRYVGIALVPVNVADAELERLAQAGFRGVRFNFMRHLAQAATIEEVIAFTPRLALYGLHLQVHFEGSLMHEIGPWLLRSAVPVVIDHIGRVDALLGADHADFAALHALLRDERLAVKVSGVDRIDRAWPYAAGVAMARTLVDSYPDRCVWGTDWPHPNHHHQPDDAQLVELLPAIATDAHRLHALLVDNPARIYRFAP